MKRRAEDEDDSERIRDLPDVENDLSTLIDDHREMYPESVEGQDEPVCEEKIALPPQLHDEASTCWYCDDISGKVLDTQGVQQARKDEIKIIDRGYGSLGENPKISNAIRNEDHRNTMGRRE